MKVISLLVAIAFTAGVMAEASPKIKQKLSLCGYHGMSCAKAKRAADAVADALASAEPKIKSPLTLCGYHGMSCAKARSILSEVADAVDETATTVSARSADAEAAPKIKQKLSLCGYHGMSCAKSKRDAEAEPKIKSPLTRCGYQGISCKRSERGIDLVKADNPELFKDECFAEGGECHAVLKAAAAFHQVKREAEAEAKIKSPLTRCGYQGISCKRDEFAYEAAKVNGDAAAFEAEAACNAPDGDCTVAQRSLDSLEAVVNKAVADVYRLD
nr:hypothetical protein B0A51_11614 [Rachicladosporium sp. CCFEE 5018]